MAAGSSRLSIFRGLLVFLNPHGSVRSNGRKAWGVFCATLKKYILGPLGERQYVPGCLGVELGNIPHQRFPNTSVLSRIEETAGGEVGTPVYCLINKLFSNH